MRVLFIIAAFLWSANAEAGGNGDTALCYDKVAIIIFAATYAASGSEAAWRQFDALNNVQAGVCERVPVSKFNPDMTGVEKIFVEVDRIGGKFYGYLPVTSKDGTRKAFVFAKLTRTDLGA